MNFVRNIEKLEDRPAHIVYQLTHVTLNALVHYNKDPLILQHNLARFGYQLQTVLQQYFLMRTFRHANAILTRIFIDIKVQYIDVLPLTTEL